jgi:hypothetical protein
LAINHHIIDQQFDARYAAAHANGLGLHSDGIAHIKGLAAGWLTNGNGGAARVADGGWVFVTITITAREQQNENQRHCEDTADAAYPDYSTN